MIINYKLLDDEVFFGGAINDGIYMPFTKETTYEIDMNIWHSGNQASALIFSNKGKIYYSVRPMKIKFDKGNLTLEGHDIQEYSSDVPTIQGTHKYICNHIFKECKSYPDLAFFEHPQFNTWIEMEWDCTEKKVLNYAKKITNNGYGGGILMIDDCWCEDYGVWEFDKKTGKGDPGKIPCGHLPVWSYSQSVWHGGGTAQELRHGSGYSILWPA